ncbi:hypothetical protein LZG74_25870 [Dyadobacter sp. CY327]|uniref:hypothetical protein n=1 Tax=Dyadobacter sp. CY327 TaxID=2907301 RepID=UPI001F2B41F9|nr:hypothetical protein [Dyadobacter sp. CY327]MCE7073762.1 hypothetical protein [Dyadobacter sp. CY327]
MHYAFAGESFQLSKLTLELLARILLIVAYFNTFSKKNRKSLIFRVLIVFDKLSGAPNSTKLELFVRGFEEVGGVVFQTLLTQELPESSGKMDYKMRYLNQIQTLRISLQDR